MPRRDAARLLDIVLAARKIVEFTSGESLKSFSEAEVLQLAVVRLFEIIGEAASNLSEATRATFPGIPWRQVRSMRNHLAHEYFAVDIETVWCAALEDVPELLKSLEPIVGRHEE